MVGAAVRHTHRNPSLSDRKYKDWLSGDHAGKALQAVSSVSAIHCRSSLLHGSLHTATWQLRVLRQLWNATQPRSGETRTPSMWRSTPFEMVKARARCFVDGSMVSHSVSDDCSRSNPFDSTWRGMPHRTHKFSHWSGP